MLKLMRAWLVCTNSWGCLDSVAADAALNRVVTSAGQIEPDRIDGNRMSLVPVHQSTAPSGDALDGVEYGSVGCWWMLCGGCLYQVT